MTAKEFLKKIIKLRKAIDYRKTKIEILEAECERITAQITGMPRGSGESVSQMESAVCRKMDLEQEIDALEQERNALIKTIDLIDDPDLSDLLTMRYVGEDTWADISSDLGYTLRHVMRLHQKAITLLDEALERCH